MSKGSVMASSESEEINVFYIPHLRMKQLVVLYLDKVKVTDFTNLSSVSSLLKFLKDTFLEFKYHEEIEENIIMNQLHNRMKSLRVEDPRIYPVHGNIQIYKVTSLIDDGIAMTEKSSVDFAGFASELVEAINSFTACFLPHMKEEEQVFQPLLVQYFGYSELKDIQELVVKEHNCQVPVYNIAYESVLNLSPDDLHNTNSSELIMNENVPEVMKNITDLPSLITTKIFSYLEHRDLGHCAQVCWSWNVLVYQASLWRTVCPVQWAEGVWNNNAYWNADEHKIMNSTHRMNDIAMNLSADIPSYLGLCTFSTDVFDLSIPSQFRDMFRRYKAEIKMFSGLVQYVLPRVGHAVRKLDLGASCTLNDKLLNVMLLQCPNVEELDVSYTALSYGAFRGIKGVGSCRRLKKLSFAGCSNIEDSSVLSLVKCWEDDSLPEHESTSMRSIINVPSVIVTEQDLLHILIGLTHRKSSKSTQKEDKLAIPYAMNSEINKISGLTSLNLSGCSKLSDKSIEELMKVKISLVNLKSLDLSGCFRFSARILNSFVKCCPKLPPENLFYCDHISGGPYSNEANGCCNLQSSERACCVPLE